jgi:hypothetical protein
VHHTRVAQALIAHYIVLFLDRCLCQLLYRNLLVFMLRRMM